MAGILEKHAPTRSLRSIHRSRLVIPHCRLKQTEKAFFAGGPKLWNSLSLETRESENVSKFKTNLKTELFRRALEEF